MAKITDFEIVASGRSGGDLFVEAKLVPTGEVIKFVITGLTNQEILANVKAKIAGINSLVDKEDVMKTLVGTKVSMGI